MTSRLRVVAPWHDWLAEPLSRDHLVQLYRDEESLAAAVETYAGAGLAKGESVVLIATPEHADTVRLRLAAEGFETEDLERWGQLRVLDARQVLEELLVAGNPDQDQFRVGCSALISDARGASRSGRIRLYGEMVSLLWSRGQEAAALRLEGLWSEVVLTNAVPLFCAYRVRDGRALSAALCEAHTHVVPLQACG